MSSAITDEQASATATATGHLSAEFMSALQDVMKTKLLEKNEGEQELTDDEMTALMDQASIAVKTAQQESPPCTWCKKPVIRSSLPSAL